MSLWNRIRTNVLLQTRSYAGRPKAVVPFITSSQAKTYPAEFLSILTHYGWFLIPNTHYTYAWTSKQLETLLTDRFQTMTQVEPKYSFTKHTDTSYSDMQGVIDDWVLSFTPDSSSKAKNKQAKNTSNDDYENDINVYMETLKADLQREIIGTQPPTAQKPMKTLPATKRKVSKTTEKRSYHNVTYIHAWNYYFLKRSASVDAENGLTKKQIISMEWKNLPQSDKEIYRKEYGEILANGMDIVSGKIVPKSEKKPLRKKKSAKKEVLIQNL